MSYKFGSQSLAALAKCHPALRSVADRALEISAQDFTVTACDVSGLGLDVSPHPTTDGISSYYIIAAAFSLAAREKRLPLKWSGDFLLKRGLIGNALILEAAATIPRSLSYFFLSEPAEGSPPASSQAATPPPASRESIAKGGPAYEKLIAWLKAEEGLILKGHWDRIGKVWDIGHGYNLTAHGVPANVAQNLVWTPEQADKALRAEVAAAMVELESHWPRWDDEFDQVRQAVFASGVYQLGVGGAASFVSTITCIRAHDFPGAVRNLQASKWARQTPARVSRIEQMLLTGEWPASANGVTL